MSTIRCECCEGTGLHTEPARDRHGCIAYDRDGNVDTWEFGCAACAESGTLDLNRGPLDECRGNGEDEALIEERRIAEAEWALDYSWAVL